MLDLLHAWAFLSLEISFDSDFHHLYPVRDAHVMDPFILNRYVY